MTKKMIATSRCLDSVLAEWGVPVSMQKHLEPFPEIIASIANARRRLPLPSGYTPRVIEVCFDDVVSARIVGGRLVYEAQCPPGYVPPFIEFRLDGQMAWFQLGSQVLVDRLSRLASLDQTLRNAVGTLLELEKIDE